MIPPHEWIEATCHWTFSRSNGSRSLAQVPLVLICCAVNEVLLLTPELDPKLLGWGPVSGQAARALRGKATVLYRSLRRVALDLLAAITDKTTG